MGQAEDNVDSSAVITPRPDISNNPNANGIVTDLKGFIPDGLIRNSDLNKSNSIKPTEDELNQRNSKSSQINKMEAILRTEVELEKIQKQRPSDGTKERKGWERFWQRTMADMLNKNLLPVKILFFFKAATLFVLYPFLTLHIKSLGLDAAEAGINSAFIPIVAIIGPPVAGVIADKIGNFRVFLAAMTLVTAGMGLLLLLVPVARETVQLPADITFSIGCGGGSESGAGDHAQFLLQMVDSSVCTLNESDGGVWKNLHPSEVQCGKVCQAGQRISSLSKFSTLPLETNKTYLIPGKKLTFRPFMKRRPDLICGRGENVSCFLAFKDIVSELEGTTVKMGFSELKLVNSDGGAKGKNITQLSLSIEGEWEFSNYKFDSAPGCVQGSNNGNMSSTSGPSHSSCVEKCLVNFDRKLFCSNTKETLVHDVALTFWLYTLFRIILGLGSATTWIMFEGAVLAILKEWGGDYGLQRVSALLAAIIVSPISGSLIYIFNDFRPAFYLYAILQTVSAILTLKIDLTFKKPAEEVWGHLKEVLSQAEILIFFFAMFLSGSVWGYLESFLFWFLKNLGGSEILMGLTISVGGLAGLPLLVCSRLIIKKIGHVNVLVLGLVFYCVRLFGYSIITNPWACLPMEAMEAITNSLAITAAATYAAALSTEQTIASIQGFMGALYFGIGRGAGSLTGGFLMKWYGDRVTFQIFAVVALVSAIIYFLINLSYLKKHSKVKGGLDLSNLRGNKHDEESREPRMSGDGTESSSTKGKSEPCSEERAFELMKVNGGYVGPCDVNSFTDIPLDEDLPSRVGSDAENGMKARPASFPEKSKQRPLHLAKRPAES